MPIVIRPYTQELVNSVKQFNQRLRSARSSSDFLFFEHPFSESFPKTDGAVLFEEYFLALDGDAVRGGFALKHQEFFFSGEKKSVAFYHFPLSEGIVDKRYVNVGVQMLRHALHDNPLLFALGMGGFSYPLPRMLRALGFKLAMVPFYFRVARPFRFLRHMTEFRRSRARRLAADLAAFSGLGSLGVRLAHALRDNSRSKSAGFHAVEVEDFGDWTDSVWRSSYREYTMIADRSKDALNLLYPARNKRFIRIKVKRAGQAIGWLLLLDTQMNNNRHFGNLRVGSIVDCLATTANAETVVHAGKKFLLNRGVDLIISNQSHAAWTGALRANGFLQAPSNCVFAASPKLAPFLEAFPERVLQVHMNRGDGDGPIHL